MSQLEKEEVTQAIVIADNFNEKFSPMTDNGPLVSKSLSISAKNPG
jgi:hypothetical protein